VTDDIFPAILMAITCRRSPILDLIDRVFSSVKNSLVMSVTSVLEKESESGHEPDWTDISIMTGWLVQGVHFVAAGGNIDENRSASPNLRVCCEGTRERL